MKGAASRAATLDVEPSALRTAMRHHAASVAVVTGRGEHGHPLGFTASTFTSASLSPPLVSFYVASGSNIWAALNRSDRFGINLLADRQADLADRFAARVEHRFDGVDWSADRHGVPFLEGAVLHLACERDMTAEVGDHTLVVGLVVRIGPPPSGRPSPLLRHGGAYRSIAGSEPD